MFTYPGGECGLLHGLCVDVSSQPNTMLEVRVGEEVLDPEVSSPGLMSRAYAEEVPADACVEVRVRDVRGNRSEPNVICGDAIRRVNLRESLDEPVTCDNYLDFIAPPGSAQMAEVLASDGDGCAMGSEAPKRANVAWLGLGLVALLAARRGRS